MRIVAFGDIHMDLSGIETIPGLERADLVIITGDFTNFGGRQDAERVLARIMARNRKVLALPGNMDQPEVDDFLKEQGVGLHGRGVLFGEIGLIGVGGSNQTPFNTPLEFSEQELAALIDTGAAQVEQALEKILVSHAPPLRSKTDVLANGAHVGSSAVRAFIEEHQPALCLTGHIHEARAHDRIGRTLIINPGMLKDGGWVELITAGATVTVTRNGMGTGPEL